jgi:phosphoribosylformylglycinamidine cyclo-ligase
MQKLGNVSDREMFRTFNMGIGMIVVASREDASDLQSKILGARQIGKVVAGNKEVRIN